MEKRSKLNSRVFVIKHIFNCLVATGCSAMKVSLVTVAEETGGAYYVQPIRGCEHGGIQALASFLRVSGYTVLIIDGAALSLPQPEVLARLSAFNADVVGFSPTLASMKGTLEIAKATKQWSSPPTVILGGHHATLCADAILTSEPHVDFIFYGEAENSLVDFLKRIENGGSDSFKGRVRRVGDLPVWDEPSPIVEDLDRLPFGVRDTLCELQKHHPIVGTTIQSSRGCPFDCTFCTSPAFYKHSPKYRKHTPRYVADEMEKACGEFDVHLFNFTDDLFLPAGNRNKVWACEFATELIERKLPVAFSIMVRAELFQPECSGIFQRLKQAGLHQVLIGIENVSHNSLTKYNKGTKISDYMTAVECLESLDLFLVPAFINLNPFLTHEEFLENVAFLTNVVKDPTLFQYTSRLVVFPGTPMEHMLRKEGLLVETESPYVDGLKYRFIDPVVQALADGFDSVSDSPFPVDNTIEEIQHLMAHSRAVDIMSDKEYGEMFKYSRRLHAILTKAHSDIMKECARRANQLDSRAVADAIRAYYSSGQSSVSKQLTVLKNNLLSGINGQTATTEFEHGGVPFRQPDPTAGNLSASIGSAESIFQF